MPERIQRKRTKGWRLPEDAVYVGRPSKWGNPFRVGERIRNTSDDYRWPYIAESVPGGARGFISLACTTNELAVQLFTNWLIEYPPLMVSLDELAGYDLACWCPLPEPGEPDICHAAILLDLANGGTT